MTTARPTSTRLNPARERGIAVMWTALLLVFTIPVVGLAIDAGLLYLVRSKLSSACDAAALATARNLNLGMTLPAQMANAQARGIAFFNANFPNGYLGTSGVTPEVLIDDSTTSSITVRVSATGSASLYFMRLLGPSVTIASASGQATRRSVNIIMVLDRSGSMSGAPCTARNNASNSAVQQLPPCVLLPI
jgi:Flp pilus assembly protein TadG